MALLLRKLQISRQLLSRAVPSYLRSLSTEGGMDLRYNDDVAVITMRNKDNRMNPQFVKDFNLLLDDVEGNKNCKGLITTAEGKFFSNGVDLAWGSSVSGEELASFLFNFNTLFRRILLFPILTLAAMNGHAFAGGAILAAAHDLRVMNSEKGWYCLNEVFVGVRFSEFFMQFLRIKLGGGKNLADALVLARRFTAQEAITEGLIHGASPMASLEADSMEMLRTYLGKDGIPRHGVVLMKDHIYSDAEKAYQIEAAENFETFALPFMNDAQRAAYKKFSN